MTFAAPMADLKVGTTHGSRRQVRGGTRLIRRTIASGATYSAAGNRIASVGTRRVEGSGARIAWLGRSAIDAVARAVELVCRSRLDPRRGEAAELNDLVPST